MSLEKGPEYERLWGLSKVDRASEHLETTGGRRLATARWHLVRLRMELLTSVGGSLQAHSSIALLCLPKARSPARRFCSLGVFWIKSIESCALQNSSSSQLCSGRGLGLGGSMSGTCHSGGASMVRKGLGSHELRTRKGRLSPEETQMLGGITSFLEDETTSQCVP